MALEQPTKTPAEEVTLPFNFRPEAGKGLRTGEVIQGSPAPTVVAAPVTVPALDVDNVVLSGDVVEARFRNGLGGTTYHVTVTVTTVLSAQSQVRQLCGDLLVKAC